MAETSNKPTDFNRALRDAQKGASDVAEAATAAASKTAGSFERAIRNTIENQPYTAAAIALGVGWLLGRMHRPL